MAAHLQALQVAKPMHNCCPPLLLMHIVKMTTSTTTLVRDLSFHTVECGHNFFTTQMLTCSLGRSMSNLMSGGTPPANRISLRLLLSLARLASVLAAISVVLWVDPESRSLTRRWMAPASLMAEKN